VFHHNQQRSSVWRKVHHLEKAVLWGAGKLKTSDSVTLGHAEDGSFSAPPAVSFARSFDEDRRVSTARDCAAMDTAAKVIRAVRRAANRQRQELPGALGDSDTRRNQQEGNV
jgi:hypothetical protein